MKGMRYLAVVSRVVGFRRSEAFVEREVNVCQSDLLWRPREAPAAGMATFRHEKTGFAQAAQDATHDDGVCPRMCGDVGRLSDAIRLSGHVAQRVKGE